MPDQQQPEALAVTATPQPPSGRVALALTISGLVIFALGTVLARVLHSADDPTLGADVGDTVKTLGMVLASFGGPFPVPPGLRAALGSAGSKALVGLLIGGVLAAGSIMPGCSGSQYAAQRRADVDWWPGPPCHLEVRLDGERKPVVTIDAPEACEPEPQQTPTPEV